MKSTETKKKVRIGDEKEETTRKSSILFIQLGLVLALIFAYIAIEYQTQSETNKASPFATTLQLDEEDTPPEINIEIIQEPIQVKPEPIPILVDIKKVDDNHEEEETAFIIPDEDPEKKTVMTDYHTLIETPIDEPDEEDVPFFKIENAPVFPGCTGSQEEIKKCFSSSINKFVAKKFDTELAQELGLSPGRQRISVAFTVDKNGLISDFKVRAPHKRLEKEAKRVVKLLPKMTPGKQRGKAVGVKFNLPIVFEINDF